MRDIAREAGMIAGSIYYHFPSKEDLFPAVYEEGVRRISARVSAAIAGIDDPGSASRPRAARTPRCCSPRATTPR
ncbi:MAG: TetR/AcrR family transcriptional regulator [Gammaproteobacteria bacterium]|nr:TetR/AcrR family transcriptional regulator [Gammaproteobacteria bacterium]